MTTNHHIAPAPTIASGQTSRGYGRVLMGIARVLIGLLGASGLAGATYFTFFAGPSAGGVANVLDVMVGVWKIGIALTMLGVALLPRVTAENRVRLALLALALDLAFSVVKLLGYDEQTAWTFMLMTFVAGLPWLGLWWTKRGLER